jgi:hypothetical protein
MRISVIIMVLLCSIGCSTTSNMQCDELYATDYNCDIPQRTSYNSYYPNTQTIYYTPQVTRRRHHPHTPHNHIVVPIKEENTISKKRTPITSNTKRWSIKYIRRYGSGGGC